MISAKMSRQRRAQGPPPSASTNGVFPLVTRERNRDDGVSNPQRSTDEFSMTSGQLMGWYNRPKSVAGASEIRWPIRGPSERERQKYQRYQVRRKIRPTARFVVGKSGTSKWAESRVRRRREEGVHVDRGGQVLIGR